MTVKFKSISKKNPRDLNADPLVYASSIVSNKVDLDELSDAIAHASTVSRADVYAVLISLVEESVRNLSSGNHVYLGKLGSLAVNVKSEGVETAEKLTSANIKGAKVIYRPGAEIKTMLNNLKYEKVNS